MEKGNLLHVVQRHCVNREVKQQEVYIFDLPRPPTPGARPLQTIPHPRGLKDWTCPRGGMVRGKIEPCIRTLPVHIHITERC